MGLTVANAVSTPGTKEPNADYEAAKTNETEFQNGFGSNDGSGRQQRTIDAVDTVMKNNTLTNNNGPRKPIRHVTFKEETEKGEARAYATIYGVHLSLIKSTHTGMVQMQTPYNPYTSKSQRVMRRRQMQHMGVQRQARTLTECAN